MIRRPPRSTLFPLHDALPISLTGIDEERARAALQAQLLAGYRAHDDTGFPVFAFRLHQLDRKSTRLNSSHGYISYAVFCLKKKKQIYSPSHTRSMLVLVLLRP